MTHGAEHGTRAAATGLRLAALVAVGTLCAAPLHAQSMARVADICSDPMTSGPQKAPLLEAAGWTRQEQATPPAARAIASAHIASFTTGMKDWSARYDAIPQLADNFTRMIDEGAVTLWTKGAAYLAVSLQQTPERTEHLACYYAGPENPETLEVMARYGTPEEVPDQGLTALRFDETAMVMDPDRSYKIYSFFSRHQNFPELATPDGYRLERIEDPQAE